MGILVFEEADVALRDALKLVEAGHQLLELEVLLAELAAHRFEVQTRL